MESQNQLAPSFAMYEATVTVTFLNGLSWAENAAKLSDCLMSFIPMEDRPDEESRALPDNTHLMTLLDVPEFSDITTERDEATAEEEHSVRIAIAYQR